MKKFLTTIACFSFVSLASTASYTFAKDDVEETTEELRSINAYMEGVEALKGKINTKADYYIYLGSASHCPACVALMPSVVREYSKLKRKKVELILICGDKNEEDTLEYAKDYKVKFPVLHYAAANNLPGRGDMGGAAIPNAVILDADGNVLAKGHGRIVLDWKKTIAAAEKEAKKEAAAAKREAAKDAREAAKND